MRLLALTALLLLSQSQLLRADVIVDFGGQYLTGNQPENLAGIPFQAGNVNIDGGFNDAIGGYQFSTTTPLSPSSNYNNSASSAIFYGGAILGEKNVSGPVNFKEAEISKGNAAYDSVHLHGGPGLRDLHAVFLWKQENFRNQGLPIYFDSTSSVYLRLGQAPSVDLVNTEIRLLVQDSESNYWLSEKTFFEPHNNKDFTWTFASGATSDGNWASYDPTKIFPGLASTPANEGTDLRFTPGGFVNKNFSSIQAIGFYADELLFRNNVDFHFEEFVVNAASVPEPASMIQLSLVAMLAAARFRRRAKLKAKEQLNASQNPLA